MNWLFQGRNLKTALGVFLVALGMPIGAAIETKLPFGAWLVQWSPIIGGAMAVGAALLTVAKMSETDERADVRNQHTIEVMTNTDDRQQIRHEEIIRLSLRSDALILDRAAIPFGMMISASAESMIGEGNEIIERVNSGTGTFDLVGGILEQKVEHVHNLLYDASIIAARHLFDGETNNIYDRIGLSLKSHSRAIGMIQIHSDDTYFNLHKSAVVEIGAMHAAIGRLLADFSARLTALRLSYR